MLRELGTVHLRHAVGDVLSLSDAARRCTPLAVGQVAGWAGGRGTRHLADTADTESDARGQSPQRVGLTSHVLLVLQRHHGLLGAPKVADIDLNHVKNLRVVGLNGSGRYTCQLRDIL